MNTQKICESVYREMAGKKLIALTDYLQIKPDATRADFNTDHPEFAFSTNSSWNAYSRMAIDAINNHEKLVSGHKSALAAARDAGAKITHTTQINPAEDEQQNNSISEKPAVAVDAVKDEPAVEPEETPVEEHSSDEPSSEDDIESVDTSVPSVGGTEVVGPTESESDDSESSVEPESHDEPESDEEKELENEFVDDTKDDEPTEEKDPLAVESEPENDPLANDTLNDEDDKIMKDYGLSEKDLDHLDDDDDDFDERHHSKDDAFDDDTESYEDEEDDDSENNGSDYDKYQADWN